MATNSFSEKPPKSFVVTIMFFAVTPAPASGTALLDSVLMRDGADTQSAADAATWNIIHQDWNALYYRTIMQSGANADPNEVAAYLAAAPPRPSDSVVIAATIITGNMIAGVVLPKTIFGFLLQAQAFLAISGAKDENGLAVPMVAFAVGFGGGKVGGQIGAGIVEGTSPFNSAAPGVENCVNCVIAFIKSAQSGEVVMSEGVSVNGGYIKLANIDIIEETGISMSNVYKYKNALGPTANSEQVYIVYEGTSASVSDHVLLGMNSNGKMIFYDPQIGKLYVGVGSFEGQYGQQFTAYPIKLNP